MPSARRRAALPPAMQGRRPPTLLSIWAPPTRGTLLAYDDDIVPRRMTRRRQISQGLPAKIADPAVTADDPGSIAPQPRITRTPWTIFRRASTTSPVVSARTVA